MREPSVLKPLILINAYNILQILSGTYLIVFYAVDIITEICNFDEGHSMQISTMQSAVLTALIRLILTMVYCFLLLKLKRRKLYLSSCVFSAIFSITLSAFLYWKGDTAKSFNDLIIIGILMLLYISANTCSMLMPGIMVGHDFYRIQFDAIYHYKNISLPQNGHPNQGTLLDVRLLKLLCFSALLLVATRDQG